MNLRDLFNLSLVNRRDEIGLEWKGVEYTFGEIDQRSDRMAASLIEQGLTQGDRLCVQLANCIELIDLYLACVKLGVIFVPINILYRDREVNHILNDAEPKLFVDGTARVSTRADALIPDARRRRPRGAGLHLRHHRTIQRRDSHAQ